jgi:hypothetical protein
VVLLRNQAQVIALFCIINHLHTFSYLKGCHPSVHQSKYLHLYFHFLDCAHHTINSPNAGLSSAFSPPHSAGILNSALGARLTSKSPQ